MSRAGAALMVALALLGCGADPPDVWVDSPQFCPLGGDCEAPTEPLEVSPAPAPPSRSDCRCISPHRQVDADEIDIGEPDQDLDAGGAGGGAP